MSTLTVNLLLNLLGVLLGGGAIGIVLKYKQGMKGLDNEEDRDIRGHYAGEVERLVKRVYETEDRQRQCEEREQRLRERILELENDVLGLINIIRQASADKVLTLDSKASDLIKDMARRIKNNHNLNQSVVDL